MEFITVVGLNIFLVWSCSIVITAKWRQKIITKHRLHYLANNTENAGADAKAKEVKELRIGVKVKCISLLSAHFKARPVSYYALLKGWLLPSPPPGCLCWMTSFDT
jgi:hypothetical protein